MRKHRGGRIAQKLTVKNLILITAVNIWMPIISCSLVHPLIRFQMSHYLLDSVPDFYFRRLIFLILCLDIIILSMIDYLYVIQPFSHLEDVVREYGKLTGMDANEKYDAHAAKSRLEKSFLDMLAMQKEIDLQAEKKENQRQTTELYALQTQINPHFLYNTLDSIRGYALIHHVDEIADMTEALSRLFRSMIAKEGKLLLLREEFESVRNYMAIQDFRFHQKFCYECSVPDDLMDNYMIPNMSLQPLVENALMHGLEQKFGQGRIQIAGYATEKRLVLRVLDNGVGIEEERLNYLNERLQNYREIVGEKDMKNYTGIALININKRIKLEFGEQYGIYITSTPDIATATELTLPVIRPDSKERGDKIYD